MNNLNGKIIDICHENIFHALEIKVGDSKLKIFTLQLNDTFEIKTEVEVLFKETAPILVKGDEHVLVSAANRVPVTVKSIKLGYLFAEIYFESNIGGFTSLLTIDVVNSFDLHKGDMLTAFIKASDISIGKLKLPVLSGEVSRGLHGKKNNKSPLSHKEKII